MNLVINASEAIGEQSGVITLRTGAGGARTRRTIDRPPGARASARAPTWPWRWPTTAAGMSPGGAEAGSSTPSSPPSSPAGAWAWRPSTASSGATGAASGWPASPGGAAPSSSCSRPPAGRLRPPAPGTPAPGRRRPVGRAGHGAGGGRRGRHPDRGGEGPGQRAGFATLQARDGREALSVFEQHRDRIRLILMDLTMPNMDGEETCGSSGAGAPPCRSSSAADSTRRTSWPVRGPGPGRVPAEALRPRGTGRPGLEDAVRRGVTGSGCPARTGSARRP